MPLPQAYVLDAYGMPLPSQRSRTFIEDFYMQYPTFRYDPSRPIIEQFYKLCDHQKWKKSDVPRRKAYGALKDAMVKQFNELYGKDEDDIRSWRMLCQVLRVSPIPQELVACREAVRAVHVNLVDLTEAGMDMERNDSVRIFESEYELSTYTKGTEKFFPMRSALAGGLLKFLLRHIFNPSLSDRPSASGSMNPPAPPAARSRLAKRKRDDDDDDDGAVMVRRRIPNPYAHAYERPPPPAPPKPTTRRVSKEAAPPLTFVPSFSFKIYEEENKARRLAIQKLTGKKVLPPIDLTIEPEPSSSSRKTTQSSHRGLSFSPIEITDSEDDKADVLASKLPSKPPVLSYPVATFSFSQYKEKAKVSSTSTQVKREDATQRPRMPALKIEPVPTQVSIPSPTFSDGDDDFFALVLKSEELSSLQSLPNPDVIEDELSADESDTRIKDEPSSRLDLSS